MGFIMTFLHIYDVRWFVFLSSPSPFPVPPLFPLDLFCPLRVSLLLKKKNLNLPMRKSIQHSSGSGLFPLTWCFPVLSIFLQTYDFWVLFYFVFRV